MHDRQYIPCITSTQFIKNQCIEGLGRRKFDTAFEILKRMQEGDYVVSIDGIDFNGNSEEDVSLLTTI